MAKDKKSFILYCDIITMVEQLPNDKAGELFKHVLRYVNDLNPITEDLITNISFEPIKQALKRDLKKYENICERNKNNGLNGGRPKNPNEPKKPSGIFGNPNEPKKPDSDSDSDIEIIYNIYPSKCPIRNRSTGKCVKDKDKIGRLLKEKTKEQLISIIDLYIKDCTETKTYIKNFSTFLNNLPDILDEKQEIKPKQIDKNELYGLKPEYANQLG